MNRRDHLKTLILGTAGVGLAAAGCKTDGSSVDASLIADEATKFYGRTPKEAKHDARLHEDTFFNAHELETIVVLGNTIMPPSEFGGIVEANVPEFIEFMAKDYESFQIPLRGGLAYLDHAAKAQHSKEYKDLTEAEQATILDPIAYPLPEGEDDKEDPLAYGRNFFNLIRGLICTGYFTSEVGHKDIGYKGNVANIWDGVPQDVLDKHGVQYDPEWVAKCVDQEKREVIAEWDDEGNLLT